MINDDFTRKGIAAGETPLEVQWRIMEESLRRDLLAKNLHEAQIRSFLCAYKGLYLSGCLAMLRVLDFGATLPEDMGAVFIRSLRQELNIQMDDNNAAMSAARAVIKASIESKSAAT